jgi:hypothetical protein
MKKKKYTEIWSDKRRRSWGDNLVVFDYLGASEIWSDKRRRSWGGKLVVFDSEHLKYGLTRGGGLEGTIQSYMTRSIWNMVWQEEEVLRGQFSRIWLGASEIWSDKRRRSWEGNVVVFDLEHLKYGLTRGGGLEGTI